MAINIQKTTTQIVVIRIRLPVVFIAVTHQLAIVRGIVIVVGVQRRQRRLAVWDEIPAH